MCKIFRVLITVWCILDLADNAAQHAPPPWWKINRYPCTRNLDFFCFHFFFFFWSVFFFFLGGSSLGTDSRTAHFLKPPICLYWVSKRGKQNWKKNRETKQKVQAQNSCSCCQCANVQLGERSTTPRVHVYWTGKWPGGRFFTPFFLHVSLHNMYRGWGKKKKKWMGKTNVNWSLVRKVGQNTVKK